MKRFRTLCLLVVVPFTLVFPLLIGDQATVSIAVNVLLLTATAAAWNIFSGYTGYLSLGSVTYFGLGAYTLALICQDGHIPGGFAPFLLLPLAGLVAGLFAIPLGWLALLTKRYTFIVITIALFFIFQLLAFNLKGLTSGSGGIFFPLPDWAPAQFDLPFYYVALALLLLILFISWWIRHSKFGLGLLAIRDDEDRALGLGIHIQRYKLGAYVLSAICIGMIGSVAAYYSGQVFPQSAFDQTFDLNVAVIVYLGGTGTVIGPLVGGLLIQPLQAYLTSQIGATAFDVDHILLGACLLGIVLVLPEGIVPTLYKWRRKSTSTILPSGGKSVKMPAPMSHLIQMDATFRSTDPPVQVTVVPSVPNAVAEVSPEPVDSVDTQEMEALSISNAVTKISPEPIGSVNSQETIVPGVPIEQWSNQNIWPLPFDSDESLFSSTGTMGRVKAQRLVPISHAESSIMTTQEKVPTPRGESFRATQEKVPTSSTASWRCPVCRKPFHLKGNMCYCPRCGIFRPVSMAE
jgi:branched-chain amino acid transport system permease protein